MLKGQSSTSIVQMAVDRRPNASFCRALYDYTATDTSSLSFRKNDIMEVVNRLESGWWDGFLGEVRGWFPSNYVVVISDEEAEQFLYTHSQINSGGPSNHRHEAPRNRVVVEERDDWLNGDADRSLGSTSNGMQDHSLQPPPAETSDFWMPEVTQSGQVSEFYSVLSMTTLTSALPLDLLCKYPHGREVARPTSRSSKQCDRRRLGRIELIADKFPVGIRSGARTSGPTEQRRWLWSSP